MNKIIFLLLFAIIGFPAYALEEQPVGSQAAESSEKVADTPSNPQEGLGALGGSQASEAAATSQTCFSAKKCEGKILNHKDKHNCKKSTGKSWMDYKGHCYSPI